MNERLNKVANNSFSGSLVVRPAKQEDSTTLLALLSRASMQEKSFLEFNMKKQLITHSIKQAKHIYVAERSGQVIGFARESGRPGGAIMLEEILVDPEARSSGAATALITYLKTKFPSIQMKTKSTNDAMVYVAKKNDFNVIKTTPKGTVHTWEYNK